jgi:hypothetical protein
MRKNGSRAKFKVLLRKTYLTMNLTSTTLDAASPSVFLFLSNGHAVTSIQFKI